MAQAVHVAFAFARYQPHRVAPWMDTSNYLIVVAVPDEAALLALVGQAARRGINHTVVREPDLDDTVTAVALAPGDAARRLCSSLPLALREAAVVT